MKKQIIISAIATFVIVFSSCEKSILQSPGSSKQEVFEYMWKSIDEKYTFFELKNIDWDSIHTVYASKIDEDMSDEAFFDTLALLIDELRDGHSGISSFFNKHLNAGFFLNSPENFNERLLMDNYGHSYGNITGPFRHIPIKDGRIAYIYYGSFSDDVTAADIDYLIDLYANTQGIIIDVRNNFGGSVDNIFDIAKRFTTEKIKVMGSRLKNGPSHSDFTSVTDTYIEPAAKTYAGKVCVLTNRKVYSAGSVFTLVMRELPNVTIVGDTTGGGLGLPIGTELPNGWQAHYSGSQILSVDGICYELGIPPDVQIDMKREDMDNGLDSILEKAAEIILEDN